MKTIIKNIGIVANLKKEGATRQARRIARLLKDQGASIIFEKSLAKVLKVPGEGFEMEKSPASLQALIVLGGDGTLINTFRHMRRRNLPLLGINLGGLGFLTEFTLNDTPLALRELVQGRLIMEKRSTLNCSLKKEGKLKGNYTAINDVVIGKGGLARVIQLETFIDGEYLTAYMADGLIISTPTGSTAYSLSAQGPIVSPGTAAILITPICPHTLTNRPIITGDDRVIRIKLISGPADTTLTIDGQVGIALVPGNVIEVRKGRRKLKLLTSPYSSYYQILRSKLNWGGRSHYKRVSGKR